MIYFSLPNFYENVNVHRFLHSLSKDYRQLFKTDIAKRYEEKFEEKLIKNVPQLYFYDQDGTEIHHLTGAYPANKIKDIIDYHNRDKATYNPYNAEYVTKSN